GRVGLGRLAARRQLLEELGRGPGDGGHRLLEGGLGGRGRKGDPADLADVLGGGGLDLLAGGRRLETPEGGDVAAHGPILGRGRVTPSLPDPAGALVSLGRGGQDATVGGGGRCAVGARGTEGESGGGAAGAARPARRGGGRAVAGALGGGGGGGVAAAAFAVTRTGPLRAGAAVLAVVALAAAVIVQLTAAGGLLVVGLLGALGLGRGGATRGAVGGG